MTKVALSIFKSKMSYYLRLVKSGEDIELQERGHSIARLTTTPVDFEENMISPPQTSKKLSDIKFTVSLDKKYDVVKLLLEDRAKR